MHVSVDSFPALLAQLEEVARAAGRAILEVYESDFGSRSKTDGSPVTQADERAEAIIVSALRSWTPSVPVVAEEEVARGRRPEVSDEFWLVDPLDGTREFIERNGEFTVNIALVQKGRPALGVVLAPALNRLFSGAEGLGATAHDADGRRPVHTRTVPKEGLTVVGSRSHGDPRALDAFLAARRVAVLKPAGSSLKFCLVAAGEADLYPRLGRTMEWDTAAGDAVLRAAGGRVCDLTGAPLGYGKPGFENPHFVAYGDVSW
jgi:3'(2'), 5'-bisphosphate nucleotidase